MRINVLFAFDKSKLFQSNAMKYAKKALKLNIKWSNAFEWKFTYKKKTSPFDWNRWKQLRNGTNRIHVVILLNLILKMKLIKMRTQRTSVDVKLIDFLNWLILYYFFTKLGSSFLSFNLFKWNWANCKFICGWTKNRKKNIFVW